MKEIIYTHWKNRAIEDEPGEIWKDIPGTNGTYQASSFGRIKSWVRRFYYTYENNSLKKKFIPMIMAQTKNPKGYLICGITYPNEKKAKWDLAHRIICKTFHKEIPNKPFVHHKKSIPFYNPAHNLQWVTHQENMDFIKHETWDYEIIEIEKENNSTRVPSNGFYKKDHTYIYAITTAKLGIVYVGKSDNPLKRFREHKGTAKSNPNYWCGLYLKDELDFTILKQCKTSEWEYWERYFISRYKEENPTLHNIALGGLYMDLPKEVRDKAAKKREKKVLQYDRNGNFVKEWSSYKEVAEWAGIKKASLSSTIINGNLTANSFWKIKTSENYPIKIEPYNFLTGLPIIQYTLDGKFINKWEDACKANKALGVPTSQIYIAIKHPHRMAANSLWRLNEGVIKEKIPIPRPNRTFKPIFQILNNGEKIFWQSINEAATHFRITSAHISEGIRKNKKAAGFFWEKDLSHPRWQRKHGKLI
jgi:hypothetical protein